MTEKYFQDFWSAEAIIRNRQSIKRSEKLCKILKKFGVGFEAKILELGAGVGRNLDYLWKKNYKNLSGIEWEENAIRIIRWLSPELEEIPIHHCAIQRFQYQPLSFDVIFSMGTLLHIENINEIAQSVRSASRQFIITMEDEMRQGPVHFPHDYYTLFHIHPFEQIHNEKLGEKEDFPKRGYRLRVFKRGNESKS